MRRASFNTAHHTFRSHHAHALFHAVQTTHIQGKVIGQHRHTVLDDAGMDKIEIQGRLEGLLLDLICLQTCFQTSNLLLQIAILLPEQLVFFAQVEIRNRLFTPFIQLSVHSSGRTKHHTVLKVVALHQKDEADGFHQHKEQDMAKAKEKLYQSMH